MARQTRDTARDVARRVLRRVATQDAFIAPALGAELDRAGLPERERRLATELVYGVTRHQSRLDRAIEAATSRGLARVNPAMLAILRVAAYQILFLDRVPHHAAVDDAASAARRLGGPRMAGFANGVLRNLARQGEPALPPAEHARPYVATAFSLPPWIAARLGAALGHGDELVRCAEALSTTPPLAIRVNRQRIAPAELTRRLLADHPGAAVEPSRICPYALLVSGLGDPDRSPAFAEGLFTVQDIGAQLVGHFVGEPAPAHPDARVHVLDACAGLGGKTTHLAERLGERARIDAADVSTSRLALLERALARLGTRHVTIKTVDLTRPDAPDSALLAAYDAVVLDAPCTGLGVLRRHPEAKWRVREHDIATMAALQRALLDALCPRVRPGGVLVYSVCTFTDEEGPAQVRAFMERHPDFALAAPATEPGGPDFDALCHEPGVLCTWPHRHEADAFFMARLVRAAPDERA